MEKFKYFEKLFWKNVESKVTEFPGQVISLEDLNTAFESAVFETKVVAVKMAEQEKKQEEKNLDNTMQEMFKELSK